MSVTGPDGFQSSACAGITKAAADRTAAAVSLKNIIRTSLLVSVSRRHDAAGLSFMRLVVALAEKRTQFRTWALGADQVSHHVLGCLTGDRLFEHVLDEIERNSPATAVLR